jgi:hypothetical protein
LSLQAALEAYDRKDAERFSLLRAQLAFSASKEQQRKATSSGILLNLYGSLEDFWEALNMTSGTSESECGKCQHQRSTTIRALPIKYKDSYELIGLEDMIDLNSEVSACEVQK